MIKATFFTYPPFLNNQQFNIADQSLNRDGCLNCFGLLRKKFGESNIDLSTQDINHPSKSQFTIYLEIPKNKNILSKKNNYLLIYESKLIRPDNWQIEKHKYFKKIFTWNDKFIDNKKYFKINYTYKIPFELNFHLNKKEKFCACIAGYKLKTHPLELYSERIKAIRWFEKNHPENFDLYGTGWDKHYFYGNFLGMDLTRLNRLKFLAKIMKPRFPSYKGPVQSKKEIYKKYKFAICYENIKNIPGYITEKIFDSFFAGCVPIYLGAPNITDHIPQNTFIDKRNFESYDDLYKYLKNMPDKKYINYLKNIENFLKSDQVNQFTAEYFAHTISNEIIKNLNL